MGIAGLLPAAALAIYFSVGAPATIVSASTSTQGPRDVAALAAALMMNSLLIAGVAYLFNGPLQQHVAAISAAHTAAPFLYGAV